MNTKVYLKEAHRLQICTSLFLESEYQWTPNHSYLPYLTAHINEETLWTCSFSSRHGQECPEHQLETKEEILGQEWKVQRSWVKQNKANRQPLAKWGYWTPCWKTFSWPYLGALFHGIIDPCSDGQILHCLCGKEPCTKGLKNWYDRSPSRVWHRKCAGNCDTCKFLWLDSLISPVWNHPIAALLWDNWCASCVSMIQENWSYMYLWHMENALLFHATLKVCSTLFKKTRRRRKKPKYVPDYILPS